MTDSAGTNRLSEKYGVGADFVRAIIALSQPARKTAKMQLVLLKEQFQGILLTNAYKLSLQTRSRQEAVNFEDTIATKLSQTKRVLSTLGIGPNLTETATLQPLISLLVTSTGGHAKANSFRDLENTAYKAAFGVRQLTKATIIAESSTRALNHKIDEVTRYIGLIDEIEKI